jgi:hypothetical protein
MLAGAGAQAAPVMPATPDADTAGDSAKNSGSGNDASKPNSSQPGGSTSGGLSGAVFGGGPIVGVASTSKDQSIREFNHKNHYKDWQFIYDPTMERSTALITTPAQPALQVSAPIQPQSSTGSNSSSPNSSSSPSSFGGMQNAPPAQPAPQQQQ